MTVQGRGAVVWLTGLPAAGKSTIARAVVALLRARGAAACELDGDRLRSGLCRDLGYSAADRAENVRRAAEVAALLVDTGLVAVVALISPFRRDRQRARALVAPAPFLEVFVDCPLEECIRRDPKGLYAAARAGRLEGLTGVSAPYEPPERPDLHLHTALESAEACAERVVSALRSGWDGAW